MITCIDGQAKFLQHCTGQYSAYTFLIPTGPGTLVITFENCLQMASHILYLPDTCSCKYINTHTHTHAHTRTHTHTYTHTHTHTLSTSQSLLCLDLYCYAAMWNGWCSEDGKQCIWRGWRGKLPSMGFGLNKHCHMGLHAATKCVKN